jgi:hypothetical protein
MNVEFFVAQSLEGLKTQTQAHSATWHLGEEEEWFVDQDQGLIRFTFSDGTLAEAPVQIVGTFSPEDNTFLWAWDHPSVNEALRKNARLVYEFGVEHQVPEYISSKVSCTEEDAWEFTALAVRLAEANGAYRGNAGGPWVYMTFGQVRLSKHPT